MFPYENIWFLSEKPNPLDFRGNPLNIYQVYFKAYSTDLFVFVLLILQQTPILDEDILLVLNQHL